MRSEIKPIWIGLLALPLAAFAGEQAPKPESEPISRYQAMMDRSPFALATEAAPPPVPENAGFTKDLVLTGAVRFNEGAYITLATRDQNQRFTLRTGETSNGISLVSVAWSETSGKTTATLQKGAEYGTIRFDEAALRPSPPSGAAAGAPPQGGAPGPGNGQPPFSPEKAAPSGQNQPALAPGATPGNPIIRRIRPIRSAPSP